MSVFSTQLCGHLCGDVFLLAKPLVPYTALTETPAYNCLIKYKQVTIFKASFLNHKYLGILHDVMSTHRAYNF